VCDESVDALYITLSLADATPVVAGRYALSVDADGDVTECGFFAGDAGSRCTPDGRGCFATSVDVSCGPVQVVLGRYLFCHMSAFGAPAPGPACDPPGPFTERITVSGTPARVELDQLSPGGGVTRATFEPRYTTLQPNGLGSEPVCHVAQVQHALF